MLLTVMQNSFCNDYSKALLDKYPIKSNEVLACVFLDFGSCVKCVLYPAEIVEKLNKDLNIKMKVVGMVSCSRKREANDYKKHNDWKYAVEPDINGEEKVALGCRDAIMCFINSSGDVIAQVSSFTMTKDYYQAIKDTVASYTKPDLKQKGKK